MIPPPHGNHPRVTPVSDLEPIIVRFFSDLAFGLRRITETPTTPYPKRRLIERTIKLRTTHSNSHCLLSELEIHQGILQSSIVQTSLRGNGPSKINPTRHHRSFITHIGTTICLSSASQVPPSLQRGGEAAYWPASVGGSRFCVFSILGTAPKRLLPWSQIW